MEHPPSPFLRKHYEQKYTVNDLIKEFNADIKLDYVFFWQTDEGKGYSSKGCFSQWQTSNFIAEARRYFCAEQYMMGRKALAFDDLETFEKIMSANHPREIKSLGRKIKNFDQTEWDYVKYSIVLNGNFYKFTQNEKMLEVLLSTENKILVEASPFDEIWGVGLSEDDEKIKNPNYWKGQNMLGFALMEVRDEIKKSITVIL